MKPNVRTVTLLNENVYVDLYLAYTFLRRLTTPFEKTKAFELGIIDANGKVLRNRKSLKTKEEKNAYTIFDTLVFNLKKLLEKLPFAKSRLASFAAALFLLKEQNNSYVYEDKDSLEEAFEDYFFEFTNCNGQQKIVENLLYQAELEVHERGGEAELIIEEDGGDGANNSVGTGNIAGTGHDGEDPLVPKHGHWQMIRRNRQNFYKKIIKSMVPPDYKPQLDYK